MRWQQAFRGVVVVAALACWPSAGQAGWITLTAGLAGVVEPTAASEFWYTTPAGSSVVAVDRLTGLGTIRAATGGGTIFFGGLGTPVLLDLSGGSAYLAGGDPPAGATARGPNGDPIPTPTPAAPEAGGTVPSSAARLALDLGDPTNGSRGLSVTVTDAAGLGLGSGLLSVPDGGWFVLGLGPGDLKVPDPGPTDPGPIGPPGGEPPTPEPPPAPGPSPGVPEPATAALGVTGLAGLALPWLRRRRSAAGGV